MSTEIPPPPLFLPEPKPKSSRLTQVLIGVLNSGIAHERLNGQIHQEAGVFCLHLWLCNDDLAKHRGSVPQRHSEWQLTRRQPQRPDKDQQHAGSRKQHHWDSDDHFGSPPASPVPLQAIYRDILPANIVYIVSWHQFLDALSREEHARWMNYITANGWLQATKQDASGKLVRESPLLLHTCVIAFDALSEHDQRKDHAAIESLPETVAMVGFKIVLYPTAGD